MAKINILFNGAEYAIDEANLAPATDALKAHLETLKEQGVPEFETAWKFKDTITIDEIKQVASHYPPDEQGNHTIYWDTGCGLQITILDLDTFLPQVEPDFVPEGKMGTAYQVVYNPWTGYTGDIWLYFDRSELTDYGYEIFSQAMEVPSSPDKLPGWFQVENGEVVATGPTIPVVPESSGINPAYVAPLFDVPGVDGNLPITLDGAVYKVDSTKLEPATNSLIAHIETLKGGDEGGSGLELGKEYKFKDIITEADFATYFSAIDMTEAEANGFVHSSGALYLIKSSSFNAISKNASDDTMYVIESTSGIYISGTSNMPAGWYSENMEPITAPTVVIPTDATMPTTPENTAVFFDIPSAGGTLEFGTDWKFKEKITAADVEEVFTNYALDEQNRRINYQGEDFHLNIRQMGGDISTSPLSIEFQYPVAEDPMTNLHLYYCCEHLSDEQKQQISSALPFPLDCWAAGGSESEAPSESKAPTIPSVSESTGINPEYVAPLFDLGGGGNEGDTKIVINGVEYPVDSAKLAEAKRALAAHLQALEDASN